MEANTEAVLFWKMLDNQCTPEEIEHLGLFMEMEENQAVVASWIMEHYRREGERVPETEDALLRERLQARLQHILTEREEAVIAEPGKRRNIRWWAAAAAVLVLLAAGAYLWPRKSSPVTAETTVTAIKNDVQPGTNKATLVLADGSVVSLDSAGNKVLQQGASTVRQQGGKLVYNVQGHTSALSYNTLHTPRGGEFHVTLPDGTEVWLNAATSLRYPTAFIGKERVVEVSGEAFFEVAKNAAMPFRVKVAGKADVQVLGTSFNINAYGDEPSIRTTLVDGAVRIITQKRSLILTPGEQAELTPAGQLRIVDNANIAQATAWRKGLFAFNKADLPTVMRELARWYELDVIYQGTVPKAEFSGDIDRSLTLDQVLTGLASARIHYRIEKGRKLIILP